jgi:hypothetical protein
VTVIEYVFLPERYLAPCAIPDWTGGSWLQVPALSIARKQAIVDCNTRLEEAKKFQQQERERLQPQKK